MSFLFLLLKIPNYKYFYTELKDIYKDNGTCDNRVKDG